MINEQQVSFEKQTELTEIHLETDYQRKDLKARRAATKLSLYDGSKKLKHSVPKGKKV
ncbi:hypothetical protein KI809_14125 [Geobacter pelophilus]|jgi:hypothetical protein|uniref:Uncharacterized protein n=1 Tax=Geoanaerobacter pelophilus TaxID=60036 RepID=A0AAW4LE62_9BACT|nr:hypothetical protein [Geoanaerobacter pelophilus]MBT0665441.1 hypothetical protein [Geoanaerobacter pelophilus]